MGFIWNTMRHAAIPRHALVLQEKEGTLSRKWPLVWRFGQYWCMLKVPGASRRQPFYIYRFLQGQSRVCRYYLLIHTPFVMVQVGPEKSFFWAETRTHQPLVMTATGIKKAGILVRPKVKYTTTRLKEYTFTKA